MTPTDYAEATTLGPLLRALCQDVVATTWAQRTYAANWADATRHVNLHTVPRGVHHGMIRIGILDDPMEIDADGRLHCPGRPGAGVDLDRIDDHTVELITPDPLA